jgi:hypothetical protein
MIPLREFRDMTTLAFGNSLKARYSGLTVIEELRLKLGYYYCSST